MLAFASDLQAADARLRHRLDPAAAEGMSQGGRGVATSAGAAAILWPLALLPAAVLGLLTGHRTRIVSTGSLVAAVALPVFVYLETESFALAQPRSESKDVESL